MGYIAKILGIIFRPLGKLNKDTDVRYLKEGDVTESFNTRTTTEHGQTSNSRLVIEGNEFVFAPDPITLQSKQFRLYLTYLTGVTFTFSIRTPNGALVGSNFTINTSSYADVTQFYNGMVGAFALNGVPHSVTALTTTSATEGYFDVTIDGFVIGWDYELRLTGGETVITQATTKEAIDQSLVGEWNLIGSWDLQGELILWWTTQRNLPEDFTITQITNNGSGLWRVQTSTPHGLATGEKVVLKSSGIANGEWIVTVVSTTEFDIQGTPQPFVLPTISSTSVVATNPNGIGELGRAVKNEETKTWTYFRLVRAKALNWVTKHQQDTLCKKDALRKTYRYTDDYNAPGTLYDRTINYQNDCLLTWVDPLNTYTYENIGTESQMMIQGADYDFSFSHQDQSLGAILSGNSQYAIELITDSGVTSEFSILTNPVSAVDSSEAGAATSYEGNVAGFVTRKINNFTLIGDLLDNYKWVRLSFVNYQGAATVGFSLPKVLITSNNMTIRHIGTEAYEDLDVGLFNRINAAYKTALSIDELDGRVILSNLTSLDSLDLSPFTATATHSVKQKILPSIGSRHTGTLTVNEYEKTENVNKFAGYMLNESYRYAAIGEYMQGGFTLAHWIDDIKIDNLPTNTAWGADPTRRTAGLPNMDLTNSAGTEVYVPYVEFTFDWDVLIDGVPVRDLIRKIHIVRVEMTHNLREVLASGFIVLGTSMPYEDQSANPNLESGYEIPAAIPVPCDSVPSAINNVFLFFANPSTQGAYLVDYLFMEGLAGVSPSYPSTSFGAGPSNEHRNYMSFYSWDYYYQESELQNSTVLTEKKLLVYGCPTITVDTSVGLVPHEQILDSALKEFSGFTNANFTSYDIDGVTNVSQGSTGAVVGSNIYSKRAMFQWYSDDLVTATKNYECNLDFPSGPVLHTTNPVTYQGTGSDKGFYMAQIYQARTDKFGDKSLSQYVSTGATLTPASSTVSVFGGDVFTEKSWMKHRIPSSFTIVNARADQCNVPHDFHYPGMGGGVGFYSQTRVNTQNTSRTNSAKSFKYPNIDTSIWLTEGTDNSSAFSYNHGYDLVKTVTDYAAFNSDQSLIADDFPVRIIYSEKTQPEQAADLQRNFLPLNFTDLEYKDGEIVNHRVLNSELYAWQPDRFSKLYFHSNRLISTTSGAEVITGTGDAFSNRPNQVTQYGCPNKWLIVKGRSAGGDDVALWLNPELKCFVRYGYDGTTNQGLIHGLDSWFRDNTSMLLGKDTPADGSGGCGVWNEKYKEAIFSITAIRSGVEDWDAGDNYIVGDLVIYGTIGFGQYPQIYKSKTVNSVKQPNLNPTDWEAILITNSDYYNIFTFCFSEIKNGFEYFASFIPKIYAQYRNTYLSPKPISNTGRMYEHNRGTYATYYDTQAEGWYYEGVVNWNPDEIKGYKAIRFRSEAPIERVDYTTEQAKSFNVQADFEFREDNYNAGIPMDSTVTTTVSPFGAAANPTGIATGDTSIIYGDYLKVKHSGASGVKQQIFNFIVRVITRVRGKDT